MDNKLWYIHAMEYYSVIQKQCATNICKNMDESQKHYAVQKESRQKSTYFMITFI